MFEHGYDLPLLDPRKPLDELLNGGARGQVLVERVQRNPRAREDPGSAHLARGPLDSRALVPVRGVASFTRGPWSNVECRFDYRVQARPGSKSSHRPATSNDFFAASPVILELLRAADIEGDVSLFPVHLITSLDTPQAHHVPLQLAGTLGPPTVAAAMCTASRSDVSASAHQESLDSSVPPEVNADGCGAMLAFGGRRAVCFAFTWPPPQPSCGGCTADACPLAARSSTLAPIRVRGLPRTTRAREGELT